MPATSKTSDEAPAAIYRVCKSCAHLKQKYTMGDADSQIPEQRGLDALQMTRVLDMLDEDISHLHQTVHDLEERTLRAVRILFFRT
ncbi:UNVERIFIED_CONTAM: hypothetical protein NCL1_33596 [Trichonephila clavipes]